MSDEFNIFVSAFDKLGTLGTLALIIFAFYKGWIVPVSVQTKIDQQDETRLGEIQKLYGQLFELQKTRIADLERLLQERQSRVEQGVHMLTSYIEAQDRLSKLADHLQEKTHE